MKKTELINKIKKKEEVKVESKQVINLYKKLHQKNYPPEHEDLFYKNYMVEITYGVPIYSTRWDNNAPGDFCKGDYVRSLTGYKDTTETFLIPIIFPNSYPTGEVSKELCSLYFSKGASIIIKNRIVKRENTFIIN